MNKIAFAIIYFMIGLGTAAQAKFEDPNYPDGAYFIVALIWPVGLGMAIQRHNTVQAKP